MTIKGLLTLCLLFAVAVLAIGISSDIGDAIERQSLISVKYKKQALEQQATEWESTLENRMSLKNTLLQYSKITIPVALTIFLLITLWLYQSFSVVEVKKANWKATQVRLDPETRQYPLITFEAGGKLRLHNPNTNQTVALDKENEMVPLLAQGSIAVQLQGLALRDPNGEAAKIIDLLQLPEGN